MKSHPVATKVQGALRSLGRRRGLQLGTCVNHQVLRTDELYGVTLGREFEVLTPENALKFSALSPARGVYRFREADALLEFAEAHQMQVRGHVLVWHTQLPSWLERGGFAPSELTEILTSHITTVVGRYAGRIATWDVVNEAIAEDGAFRRSLWYEALGEGYLEVAFRAARMADPTALLFYNDYGAEGGSTHGEAVYALVRDLVARGVPLDGVGLQMHLTLDHLRGLQDLRANMRRFAELGLRVHITELDVRMPLGAPGMEQQLATQAEVYRQVLAACLDEAACDTLILWGAIDRYSWVPYFFPGWGAPLIFDEEGREKPAYRALVGELGAVR